jgi:hypothetical protein
MLRFVGAFHMKNGKVIRVHTPSRSHKEFVTHSDLILNSPPKKHMSPSVPQQIPAQHSGVRFSRALQTQTTNTQSVQINLTYSTMTTTTHTSQTFTSILETRFQTIKQEVKDQKTIQGQKDQCLQMVKSHTTFISEDITAIMAFWKIAPDSKRKHDGTLNSTVGDANQTTLTVHGMGDNYF